MAEVFDTAFDSRLLNNVWKILCLILLFQIIVSQSATIYHHHQIRILQSPSLSSPSYSSSSSSYGSATAAAMTTTILQTISPNTDANLEGRQSLVQFTPIAPNNLKRLQTCQTNLWQAIELICGLENMKIRADLHFPERRFNNNNNKNIRLNKEQLTLDCCTRPCLIEQIRTLC